MHGGVGRSNGVWRLELYAAHDLPTTGAHLDALIDSFQHLYDRHKAHTALGGLTPDGNRRATEARETNLSHST